MPLPPPPPPSYFLTLTCVVQVVSDLLDLQTLIDLTYVSKASRTAFQSIFEDRWVEALKKIMGYGEDPVGRHACVEGFPICAFTTVNNLPNARGVVELLLPPNKLQQRDDIIRSWGVHNLVQDAYDEISTANLRKQAEKTLDELITQATGRTSSRLNVLVQGHCSIQLLENGLRPKYLSKTQSAGSWLVGCTRGHLQQRHWRHQQKSKYA